MRGLPLVLLCLSACFTTSWRPCSPQSCSGCCTAEGACVPGAESSACGSGGAACTACGSATGCRLGACVACAPQCDGRSCGSDGCGGTCGACATGATCSAEGGCVACSPGRCGEGCGDCPAGEQCTAAGSCIACSSNSCGGGCGDCAAGDVCSAAGVCVPSCTPSCAGKQCGSDGCGGTCGTCPAGEACSAAAQCACAPSCAGKTCGSDGCGGSCGACATGVCNAAGQCVASCTPSCAGKQCGSDGCSGSCGSCAAGSACNAGGQCECAPACVGKQCGGDGCGGSCGACPAGTACNTSNQCVMVCTAESNAAFCSRLQRQCGTVSAADNCGASRTVYCGSCAVGQACTAAGQCVSTCTPETDAQLCARGSRQCGSFTTTDDCGTPRTVYCGACATGQACSAAGTCVSTCSAETDAQLCARNARQCGAFSGTDNCGSPRTAVCGTCASGQACSAAGQCVCVSETAAAFCARHLAQCGTFTGPDNCGVTRTATCGSCAAGQTCSANACVAPPRLVFSTSWQTLPGTGSSTVEFRCAGTVTTTASGGTRCYRSAGDPVELRINGSTWILYPGCDGLRPSNCMTSITPSGATYKDYQVNAGGRLLCDAMGWPLANTLADKNPGSISNAVAVVQTNPAVVGTDPGLKNYATYVNCEP